MAEPFAPRTVALNSDPSQHEAFWECSAASGKSDQKVEGNIYRQQELLRWEWAFHIGGDTVPEGTVFYI